MANYKRIDLSKVKTYSIKNRSNKVSLNFLGKPVSSTTTLTEFFDSLPQLLRAEDLKRIAERISVSIQNGKLSLFMIGAHTLKVGLSPIFIDFMDYGKNLHFAGNGAVLIHDLEIAFFGATSEDVLENLQDGSFGFVSETAELYTKVLSYAAQKKIGLGQSLGEIIDSEMAPYREYSLAYNCHKREIPLTIHAAIGTDIVNQHPRFDGGACGEASFIDFKIFASSVMEIADGGVALNIGSAVIMPEVFLKALAICRNLKPDFGGFTTANFDMINHYRPTQNIVNRPASLNSEGYTIIGHHEIMIPILFALVKAYL